MPVISPEDFWKTYSEECKKIINKHFYCDISLGEYTELQKNILREAGKKLNYGKNNEYKEIYGEYLTVDMGYFNYPHYSNFSVNPAYDNFYNWDWDVAIEHENNPNGNNCWREELIKLWHIVCGLKVLITYNSFKSGSNKHQSLNDLKNIIAAVIGKRNFKSVLNGCIQTPFLFIFYPSCPDNNDLWDSSDEMYDAVALVYDEKGFRQLDDLPILRNNRNIKNLTN